MSAGRLDTAEARTVSTEEYGLRTARLQPQADDIVYSREGERFGFAALVPPGVKICLGQRMMHLRPNRAVAPAYLMWALNSESTYQQAVADTTGSTSPHVNVDTIRNFLIPLPSRSEQNRIAQWIEAQTHRIDSLKARIESAIALLREYRAALIHAAVTGKIDVRGEVA